MAGDESRECEPACPVGWEFWRAPYQRHGANSIVGCFFGSTWPDAYTAEAERRKDEIDGQLARLAEGIDEGAFLDEDGVTPLKATFWTEDKRVILTYGYWDPRPEARLKDDRPLPHLIIRRKDDGHHGDDDRRAIEFLRSTTDLTREQQHPALESHLKKTVSRDKFDELRRQAGPPRRAGRKPGNSPAK